MFACAIVGYAARKLALLAIGSPDRPRAEISALAAMIDAAVLQEGWEPPKGAEGRAALEVLLREYREESYELQCLVGAMMPEILEGCP